MRWNSCGKVANLVLWQQICLHFGADDLLLKFLLQNTHKSSFSASASKFGFGAAVSVAAARNSIVLCTSVSAHRSGMARQGSSLLQLCAQY